MRETGIRLRPPRRVRFQRRLGLPVPVRWRPWVAADILSEEWLRRRVRRVRWVRSHRVRLVLGVLLFEVAVAAAIDRVFGFGVTLVGIFGAPVGILVGQRFKGVRRPSEDLLAIQARAQSLKWNGLEPDGSLSLAPDRWTTLAASPPWMIATIAVLEVTVAVALGVILLGLFALVIIRG